VVLCGVEWCVKPKHPSKSTDLHVSLSVIPIACVGAMGVAYLLRSGPGVFSADCAIGVLDSGMEDLQDQDYSTFSRPTGR
jgi:hypothetical protein